MPTLALYVRKHCHLCDAARQALAPLLDPRKLRLALHDIDDPATDPILRAHYDHAVPVLHLDGREVARHRIDPAAVATALDWASTTVCVLAKFPTPGKVKTRLTQGPGAVSAAQAAEVHRLFLLHLLTRLAAKHPQRLVLAYDPPEAKERFAAMLSRAGCRTSDVGSASTSADPVIHLLAQSPGDLGTRLASAHLTLSAARHPLPHHPSPPPPDPSPGPSPDRSPHPSASASAPAPGPPTSDPAPTLLLGSDAPDLPDVLLDAAASSLQTADAVIGPTPDGGYWTLGVRSGIPLSNLLHSIPWSSGSEYAATLEAFASGRYRVCALGAWEDVDHPPDLLRLIERLAGAPDLPSKGLHAALTQLLRDPA